MTKPLSLPRVGSLRPYEPCAHARAQVVSPAAGSAVGVLVLVESLASVQRERYSRPTVLAAHAVGGEEDIPEVCDCCHLDTASVVTWSFSARRVHATDLDLWPCVIVSHATCRSPRTVLLVALAMLIVTMLIQ